MLILRIENLAVIADAVIYLMTGEGLFRHHFLKRKSVTRRSPLHCRHINLNSLYK